MQKITFSCKININFMELFLNNIGIIKDSTIKLDGLTVITGKNNSGKSTVGKVLYSLVEGIGDIRNRAELDKRNYAFSKLENVIDDLSFLRAAIVYYYKDCKEPIFFQNKPTLVYFFKRYSMTKFDMFFDNAKDMLEKFLTELQNLEVEKLINNKKFQLFYLRVLGNEVDVSSQAKKEVENAVSVVKKIMADIGEDETLEKYRRESVNQTLNVEFSNQIQPVMHSVDVSEIKVFGDDKSFFDIYIKKDSLEGKRSIINLDFPLKKAYFIDNPFILDEIFNMSRLDARFLRKYSTFEDDSFLDSHRILSHEKMLLNFLRSPKRNSVFEETIKNGKLENIRNKIDAILPGVFEFSNEGAFIVNKKKKLNLYNLATGSKFFSILKMLIEKDALDESTALILDEPESHLHPEWENIVAEITVLLAKEIGVKILLTTHSSNFMLAVDACMKKYDFMDKSNFYQTKTMDDDFVRYDLVNENMEKIYEEFYAPFSKMKQLRDGVLKNVD